MPRYKKLELGQYDIPEDAITLIEDIQTFELILKLLGKIRERSVTVPAHDHNLQKLQAQQMLRRVGFLVSSMHSIAMDNFRFDYLSGKRIKPRERRQTLADVWSILMDGKISLNESERRVSNQSI